MAFVLPAMGFLSAEVAFLGPAVLAAAAGTGLICLLAKDYGYKGAFEFSATLDYLYAFDASTEVVSDWCYEEVYKSWLCDLDLRNFFLENNPWALRDIAQRFLEIVNRKMWNNCSSDVIENLKNIIINTDSIIEKNEF